MFTLLLTSAEGHGLFKIRTARDLALWNHMSSSGRPQPASSNVLFHLSQMTRFFFFFFFDGEDSPWANICCQSSSFCLRKICPEPTSVPIFFYFRTWITATASPPMSGVDPDPGAEFGLPKQSVPDLTTRLWGWPLKWQILMRNEFMTIFPRDPSR